METNKNKKQSFFVKNIYYFVLGFILVAAIGITLALVLTGNGGSVNIIDNDNDVARGDSSQIVKPDDKPTGGNEDDKDKPQEREDPDTKPASKITFVMPVDDATVINDYTAASVSYNKTLNIYTGHLAIDFAAEAGSKVKAVYAGTVESVTTSYLTGTSVTVVHENGLKTVYNSIEADENVKAGVKVEQGQVLGTVSDNNKQEYKDGPHLHFEVYENGKKISPYKYLAVSEK